MLVVTSNWCVSDGTLSAGPPRGCLERFRAEVRRASLRCGFRRDGSYRPLDAIDVVLAGDTFDWLVSREWTGDVRPWEGGRRAAAARERVVAGALGRSDRLLATLAAWMRRGIEVPVADRRGRPMPAASQRVPVRVAMLCGDRDRWLEQAAGDGMRSARAAMVGRCWSDGDVTVRHGDDLDPLHAACGGEPTLGESLAVDLIARFALSLDDIAEVRPLAAALVRRLACGTLLDAPTRLVGWLSARDGGAVLPAVVRQGLIDAWHRSVSLWQRTARRLSPRGGDGVDLVGRIAEWLQCDADREVGRSERWVDTPPTPEMAARWDSAATVVLGHPAAEIGAPAAWRRQVVCLGLRALQSLHHLNDDLMRPAVVVIRPDREGRRIEWLPIDTVAERFGYEHEEDRGHGVWQSAVSLARHGIVDAA